MRTLGELLAQLPLGEPEDGPASGAPPSTPQAVLHDLAADLPEGHLHLWGGPEGAGKTSFLLALLEATARRGRGVAYATYDLPAASLASRLLAMVARVAVEDLPDPGASEVSPRLDAAARKRTREAREHLSALPFAFEQARGYSVTSLADRLVRLPFRPAVCAVDYLQAVVRPGGQDLGGAVRDLAGMAHKHHLSLVCAVRAASAAPGREIAAVESLAQGAVPHRVGWLESMAAAQPVARTSANTMAPQDRREARILSNRYGSCPRVPLAYDAATGAFETPAVDGAPHKGDS